MIGRYEVMRPIAQGGMAEILLARSVGIGGFEKQVVIKRMLPELASNPEFVQMFLDEARLAASLHHTNLAHVYDIGIDDGLYFFAMEYLQGDDVAELLTRLTRLNRVPPMEAVVAIALGAAAGLHYAHERTGEGGRSIGLVHRDVSPNNIFVTADGGVKLLDFGIAKAAKSLGTTRVGTVKGKLSFMSPEQVQGLPLDRRSDVFSLGVVLWELTTAKKLFDATGDFTIQKLIVESDAPLASTLRPDAAAELDRIIARALHRQIELRYQTAQEVQIDLEAFARTAGLTVSALALAPLMAELFGSPAAESSEAGFEDVTQEIGMTEAMRRIRRTLEAGEVVSAVATRALVLSTSPEARPPTRALVLSSSPQRSSSPQPRPSTPSRWVFAAVATVAVATASTAWLLNTEARRVEPSAPVSAPTPVVVPVAAEAALPVPVAVPPAVVESPVSAVVKAKPPARRTKPRQTRKPTDLDAPLPP